MFLNQSRSTCVNLQQLLHPFMHTYTEHMSGIKIAINQWLIHNDNKGHDADMCSKWFRWTFLSVVIIVTAKTCVFIVCYLRYRKSSVSNKMFNCLVTLLIGRHLDPVPKNRQNFWKSDDTNYNQDSIICRMQCKVSVFDTFTITTSVLKQSGPSVTNKYFA